jgi:DNA polymerase III epsilon subunit-like protein
MDLSNVIVIDIETTGPNAFEHELLSLALVPIRRDLPPLSIHVQVDEVTVWSSYAETNWRRFEKDWRRNALPSNAAAEIVQEYLDKLPGDKDYILAGHNVGFDRTFFSKLAFRAGRSEFRKVSHRNIDTFTLLFRLAALGEVPEEATTSTGAFRYFGIRVPEPERHTALGDALATRVLVEILLDTDQCVARGASR